MKYKQSESLLIGSKKDIKAVETKENARLLVISDSHGQRETFFSIVQRMGKGCDALIFCGDGLSDLAGILAEACTNKDFAQCVPPVIAFVAGNCDSRMMINGRIKMTAPSEQFLTVNGQKIMIVHGHAHGADYGPERMGMLLKLNGCTTAFYGHTHVAANTTIDSFHFVNPGSCARPRGGQQASFAIATVGKDFIDMAFIKTGTFELWTPIG